MNRRFPQVLPGPEGANHALPGLPRCVGRSLRRRAAGMTLLEAILLLLVLTIVAVGVSVGLQAASNVPKMTDRTSAISTELNSELENWRAVAWGSSPWPASLPYSLTDTVSLSIGGQSLTYSRTTSIQTWDPNNVATNASPQADFVRIQVTINSQVLTAYLTKPI